MRGKATRKWARGALAAAVSAVLLLAAAPAVRPDPGAGGTASVLPAGGAASAEASPEPAVIRPSETAPPAAPAAGSLVYMPQTGRTMSVVPGVEDSALVIGDSQAGPDTWVGQGLEQAGYPAIIRGAGGTGYVQGNGSVAGYARALEAHQWLLPWGTPRLIVLQGGGNDTAHPAADIRTEALRLIGDLRQSYPSVRIVMVGVIGDGTGRRSEVDGVLAAVAAEQGIDFLTPGDWWARYGLNGQLRPDGRHLSPEGHRVAAGVFARELARMMPPAVPQARPYHAVP
ncbi:SGNH/GDSL hydrolase family protein [Arthrobacter sp. zg-Y859]|uniref:SGNH/GDSL hydrolase family protein n=1 Tax=Arthrobacter jinronghuae TaxID=2964609 RepID=A0ABT1NNW1_9MICC|nr:SGNH/GDSL hydrolase family protein [Arthrobacter jinronghuae]MCQ1949417.1 SGNH/GDSL hydrolase family protein [Arthrobacter jinronghuae]MCQ1955142.1 SGNH/GDSL hydrolase family protein [Arthrobacter jinronghuae]UWX77808.1 SGNH/GDSL hydrolase family protein [Arthrobacter jinronghuae]